MTLNELVELYNGENVKIPEELAIQLKELTQYPIKNDSEYFVIASDGEIDKSVFNTKGKVDIDRYLYGNAYQTKEEAELECGFRQVKRELIENGAVYGSVRNDEAWYIAIDSNREQSDLIVLPVENHVCSAILTFPNEKTAVKAIERIGERRIIKYWFRSI